MSRPEAKREAERRLREGLPKPTEDPTRLLLNSIRKDPEAFQFRRPPEHASRVHIHEMARKAKEGLTLGAIVVWWGGDGWYCIDGYHRLEAYRIGKWPHQKPVPVVVFAGSVVLAMLKAVQCNAPGKLQMTKREQTQAAWELVVTTTKDEASAAQIARVSTVSERQVFAMRAVKKTLQQKDPEQDLTALSWERARGEAEGKTMDDDVDWDARMNEEAKQVADTLMQHLGHRYQQRPEVLALALEMFDGRLPGFLAEHWRGVVDTSDLDLEEEEADF